MSSASVFLSLELIGAILVWSIVLVAASSLMWGWPIPGGSMR